MLTQIKYLSSWTKVKMNDRLGERGAEMVEYAIVLACVAAVAAVFYATTGDNSGTGKNSLNGILTDLWATVRNKMTGVISTGN